MTTRRRNAVAVLAVVAVIPVLLQIRMWAGMDRFPFWTAREVVRDVALVALKLVDPLYTNLTVEDRQSKKDLLVAMHGHRPGRDASTAESGGRQSQARDGSLSADSVNSSAPRDTSGNHQVSPRGTVNILLISNQNGPNEDPIRCFTFHLFRITLEPVSIDVITFPGSMPVHAGTEKPAPLVQVYLKQGYLHVFEQLRQTTGLGGIDYYISLSPNKTIAILTALGLVKERAQLDQILEMRRTNSSEQDIIEATGLFARNLFLRILPLLNGISGDLLVGTGLKVIDNNIPRDVCLGLIYALNDRHIPDHPEEVVHTVFHGG